MTLFTFLIRERASGRTLGHAVLCPPARYVSVVWGDDQPLDRRFVPSAVWQEIDRQVAEQLPAGPLDRASAVAVALAGEHGAAVAVQYLSQEQLEDGLTPGAVAAALDARLRALV